MTRRPFGIDVSQIDALLARLSTMSPRPSPRSLDELVEALDRHVRVLRDHATKAFHDRNTDYGGEIAGKLRLLVTRFGSNRPLLLDLMAATGINPTITLSGPPVQRSSGEPMSGEAVESSRYLELTALEVHVPAGDFILNKTRFIRVWAEQSGSSHEDWSLDPVLSMFLACPISFGGGLDTAFLELRTTTIAVIQVAERFLSEYRSRHGSKGEGA